MTNPNADIHAAGQAKILSNIPRRMDSQADRTVADLREQLAKVQRELAAKNAVVEALRKDKANLKTAMEHYQGQVYGIFGECK
jgi:predicted  nucleic acid-binding Zn-ribbon protein